MSKQFRPYLEALAVGCVFISITMLFEIPFYMSLIIGALAALGGYRNSIKMDREKEEKQAAKKASTVKQDDQ